MGRHPTRLTVEQCRSINTVWLRKKGYLKKDCIEPGNIRWTNAAGQELGGISFIVSGMPDNAFVHFKYIAIDPRTGDKNKLNYIAKLNLTHSYLLDQKWWFLCPLITKTGQPCRKRVRTLYLVGDHFGCRHCYNLTYKSCRKSHEYQRLLKYGYSPKEARHFLKESEIRT